MDIGGNTPDLDTQMAVALRRMAAHRKESVWIDRRGWTDDEWVQDARRLMHEIDGSISSLVNGHVMALLRSLGAAWEEGYQTCLGDFDIVARCEARSPNPHRIQQADS